MKRPSDNRLGTHNTNSTDVQPFVRFQARTVGWWSVGIGIFLAFPTVFVALAGLLGIGALTGMRDDTRKTVNNMEQYENETEQTATRVAGSEERIEKSLKKALDYVLKLPFGVRRLACA